MKELVIISGKGGTGKTSIVASLAALTGKQAVLADCDVDAADLHLILKPDVQQRHDFYSGHEPTIDPARCTGCGKCVELCRYGAIRQEGADAALAEYRMTSSACRDCNFCVRSCPQRASSDIQAMMDAGNSDRTVYAVDPLACEGCGVCVHFCPTGAIDFPDRLCGEWMVSQTRHGMMVHAKLGIAAENSGKLVSTVRTKARELAEQRDADMVIIDGSPGIGCPVIASITGAGLVLIVTEPTLSGQHDLQRVADLARHFDIPAMLCVNKWDLNPEIATQIEQSATQRGIPVAGRVRYDNDVTQAQIAGLSVVEHPSAASGEDIRNVWKQLQEALSDSDPQVAS